MKNEQPALEKRLESTSWADKEKRRVRREELKRKCAEFDICCSSALCGDPEDEEVKAFEAQMHSMRDMLMDLHLEREKLYMQEEALRRLIRKSLMPWPYGTKTKREHARIVRAANKKYKEEHPDFYPEDPGYIGGLNWTAIPLLNEEKKCKKRRKK